MSDGIPAAIGPAAPEPAAGRGRPDRDGVQRIGGIGLGSGIFWGFIWGFFCCFFLCDC